MKYILSKRKHWQYFTALMLGLVSMIWQITIYRKTIIDVTIPLLIVTISGSIAFLIDRERYSSTYDLKYKTAWAWLQNIASWGFLICTLFMVLNRYFAADTVTTSTHSINSIGTMPGKPRTMANEQPLIRIDYYGKTKELVFTKEYLTKLNMAKSVTIETRNGLFGYKIIDKQTIND